MKHIKDWFTKWLNGIQKPLLWILLFDLIVIVYLDVFGRDLFRDDGTYRYRLVTFAYTLGLSYIASFIFYFVQVHLKEVKDKIRVLPSVERLFQRLVFFANEVVLDTINYDDPSHKTQKFKDTTKEGFLSATTKIKFDVESSVYQGKHELTWLEYYTYRRKQIEEYIHLILEYSQYIGEEGISILADIRNDAFLFTVVNSANSCKESGLDYGFTLGGLEPICENYYNLVQRINDYYTKELLPYQNSIDKTIQKIYLGTHKQIAI